MLSATNEERGTVAGLAALSQALDDEHTDGTYFCFPLVKTLLTAMIGDVPYAMSPRCQVRHMSSETYRLLAYTLCLRYPATPVHCRSDRALTPNSLPLEHTAIFFEYIVIDGKRFYASQTVGCNKSSLIHVVVPGPFPTDAYGEVLEILQINQDFQNKGYPLWLTRVRWLKPWCGERNHIWDDL
jgi:hypothetical protein